MGIPRGLKALFVVLSISLALNVWLGLKLRFRLVGLAPQRVHHSVQRRANLVGLPLKDVRGDERLLTFSGQRPMALYVFSPGCRYCAMNLPNIQALASAKGDSYEFVAVSNTPVGFGSFAAGSKLAAALYVLDGERMKDDSPVPVKYFDATPQLVVLSRDGKVEAAWTGAFEQRTQAEVERYFGVSLPGLGTLNQHP